MLGGAQKAELPARLGVAARLPQAQQRCQELLLLPQRELPVSVLAARRPPRGGRRQSPRRQRLPRIRQALLRNSARRRGVTNRSLT